MRLLHLIPTLTSGGAERQLSYLATELARRGHEVHIGYSRMGTERPELTGVNLHPMDSISNYSPMLIWQLTRLLKRIQPDIIQTWGIQMDILGGILAGYLRIPWIIREASSTQGYAGTWKNRMRVVLGRHAQAIISNSRGGDEYWMSKRPRGRRYVISNSVSIDEVSQTATAWPFGFVKPDKPIVLSVGRLASDHTAQKNLNSLLKALALVKQSRDILGIICGDGPHRVELEALSVELGLAQDMHFAGHLHHGSVLSLMKMADVFVSLSAYEGCPNTVMEAVACGSPLVLSDIPAHRDLIEDMSIRWVSPDIPVQVAAAINEVLEESELGKNRALSALRKAQRWSMTDMTLRYEGIYQSIMANRGRMAT